MVDRHIFMLLAEPIRKALALSDLQLGLLQGTGIALFAALASYPLGWLGDRVDRRWVLAGCIAVWSGAVLACGLAQDFGQLLLASGMVGAGEAGLAPIAWALIPMMFFGAQRQLANSIFAVTAVGGGAAAIVLSGQLVSWVDASRPLLPDALQDWESWRLSFLAAAMPAPLMIMLVLSMAVALRASRQQRVTGPVAIAPVSPTSATALIGMGSYLRGHRATFLTFCIGTGLGGFAFSAVVSWLAVICARVYGQTPAQIGAALGAGQLVSAGSGFLLSLLALRWLGGRLGPRFPLRGMWLASVACAPICTSLLLASSAQHFYIFYAIYGAGLTLSVMLYPTVLQSLSPAHLRGRMAAMQGIVTMGFAASAPPLVGLVSDRLASQPDGLVKAVVGVAVPAVLVAAALLRWCEMNGFQRTADHAAQLDEAAARA
jgi:MFS family permease